MAFIDVWEALDLLIKRESAPALEVQITSRGLSSQEAIGHPERKDFPLLRRGKEVLVQADIDGCIGQAFTGDPVTFNGSINQLLEELDKNRPGHRALAVAVLNALALKLGVANHTIHCINNEPEECASQVSRQLRKTHGLCRIGIIGYQPALLQHCVEEFGAGHVHLTDLNDEIIGSVRYGVEIWDGMKDTGRLISCSDVLLVTGTILANGTFPEILGAIKDKDFYFYGTTCAALAAINQTRRVCPKSR